MFSQKRNVKCLLQNPPEKEKRKREKILKTMTTIKNSSASENTGDFLKE